MRNESDAELTAESIKYLFRAERALNSLLSALRWLDSVPQRLTSGHRVSH